ncbi:MAG: type II secretion system protein GspL [Desulfuromonadales bacterium]|nr:type II secretion system protein GspL [Desulfuromonadales bacterium]
MSKRLIGIEIGARTLRIAVLHRQKGEVGVEQLAARDYADETELAGHLGELLTGEFRIGDQLATGLPAGSAYVRRLEFPFREERKIAAAIGFELAAQLPVAIDDCATAMQKVEAHEQGAAVTAAAVPLASLQRLLAVFETANLPVHRIDLAPFAYAAGLGDQIGSGILLCATDRETTISLLENGRLRDYRVLPAAPGQQILQRELNLLVHAANREDLPVRLIGAAADNRLASALQTAGFRVEALAMELGGQTIEAGFLPAVALALQAGTNSRERSFNFRQGAFALKGEWANLKGKLALLATLFALTVLTLCGSMTFNYLDRAHRAEQLQAEMTDLYRSLFPQAATIVDVPLQLKSALRDLREQSALFAGAPPATLHVLSELSGLPEQVTVEIQELVMGADDSKLAGRTDSFEAVNTMAQRLEASPLFAEARVTEAKMSLDGSRIDFRLTLLHAGQGGPQ